MSNSSLDDEEESVEDNEALGGLFSGSMLSKLPADRASRMSAYPELFANLGKARQQILSDDTEDALVDDNSDLGAQALLGLLPIFLGGAMYGLRGAAVGGAAGLAGTQVLAKAREKREEDYKKGRKDANKAALEVLKSDQTMLGQQMRADQASEERNQLFDREAALRRELAANKDKEDSGVDNSPEFKNYLDIVTSELERKYGPEVVPEIRSARNREEAMAFAKEIRQRNAVDERLEQTLAAKKADRELQLQDQKDRLNRYGLMPTEKRPLTDTELDKATAEADVLAQTQDAFDGILEIAERRRRGESDPTDVDALQFIAGNLVTIQRDAAGTGAAVTQQEFPLLYTLLPKGVMPDGGWSQENIYRHISALTSGRADLLSGAERLRKEAEKRSFTRLKRWGIVPLEKKASKSPKEAAASSEGGASSINIPPDDPRLQEILAEELAKEGL